MSLAARTFVVGVSDPSTPVSRASRRVIVSVDVLKSAKILAGDVVALSEPDKSPGEHRVSADFDGSTSHLSSAWTFTGEYFSETRCFTALRRRYCMALTGNSAAESAMHTLCHI